MGEAKFTVLIVEDDRASRDAMRRFLERKGYAVRVAEDGRAALRVLAPAVDAVVSDLKMEGMDGMELLAEAKMLYPEKPFLLLTAYGDVRRAVEAMKLGAEDFLTKPVDPDELAHKLERVAARRVDVGERRGESPAFRRIIGRSEALNHVLMKVSHLSGTNCAVLITGETGTGKELIAAAIHAHSGRRNGPFTIVSAVELPETLIESELFGHLKGAFTGAVADKPGRFETAHGGTLFLDEIGELSLQAQAKILRVLETKEFTRIGDTKPRKVDVRLLFATNRDLPAEVAAGRFREDLYYRINVAHVHLPPLRERAEDIPLLMSFFVDAFAKQNGRERISVSAKAMETLIRYPWPGNVRELRNVAESTVVMLEGDEIRVADLPERVRGGAAAASARPDPPVGTTVAAAELDLVVRTLRECGGNRTRAAERLGLSVRTLQRKIKEHGLEI